MDPFVNILRFLICFFIFRQPKILAGWQHCLAWQYISFAWLFWAAGGQIDFRQEGTINLQPPLNAIFNSRPE
jgi:hypothetical protein